MTDTEEPKDPSVLAREARIKALEEEQRLIAERNRAKAREEQERFGEGDQG
jgi:hypothetical protein